MTHLLVRWVDDFLYSIAPKTNICEKSVKNENSVLLHGQTTQIRWKKSILDATIITTGDKQDLKDQLKLLEGSYLLVKWKNDGQYSVMSKKSLLDSSLILMDDEILREKVVNIHWDQGVEHRAKIISTGTKDEMDDKFQSLRGTPGPKKLTGKEKKAVNRAGAQKAGQAISSLLDQKKLQEEKMTLEKQATRKRILEIHGTSGDWTVQKSRRTEKSRKQTNIVEPTEKTSKIQHLGRDIGEDPEIVGNNENNDDLSLGNAPFDGLTESDQPEFWKNKYEEQTKLCESYKNKITSLKAVVAKQTVPENKVEISEGVSMDKIALERAKTFSSKPTVFARSLMRGIFTDTELRTCSFSGKACNANKNIPAKPELDNKKRDAIVAVSLDHFYKDGNLLLREAKRAVVVRSMGDFLRECSKAPLPEDAADNSGSKATKRV